MGSTRSRDRRKAAYLAVRGGAALVFVLSALILREGTLAGLLSMGAGLVAVLTCIGVNAGGPGERAGAIAQQRAQERIRPPQGDWPPFEADRIIDGELARPEKG